MEAVMVMASVLGLMVAILTFLTQGWLPGFTLLLLSLIAYALSRVFDFIDDLLAWVGRRKENEKSPEKDGTTA